MMMLLKMSENEVIITLSAYLVNWKWDIYADPEKSYSELCGHVRSHSIQIVL